MNWFKGYLDPSLVHPQYWYLAVKTPTCLNWIACSLDKATASSSKLLREVGRSEEKECFAQCRELCIIFSKKKRWHMKEKPSLKYKVLTVPGKSTALTVCETSPPDKASSCSLCKAGPSTEEPHAAEGCGGGRKCTRGHNSKDSWQRSCRCLRNDTDVWRSKWGCGMFWRCCRTEGWTSS